MPNILNATACPAIQQPTGFFGIAASIVSANAVVAETNASGNSSFASQVLNPHARRLDDLASFGGANVCAIIQTAAGTDLKLVAPGSGLLLTVKQGKALCGGEIEWAADGTKAVPDNTARVWVWLMQSQTISATTSTTPPAGLSVLLGSCVTSGGNITSVDTSGVIFFNGSAPLRYSADPGIPTDAPPATLRFWQQTAFGLFWWNGSAYVQVGIPEMGADPTSVANGMTWFRTDIPAMSRYTSGGVKRATFS